MSKVFEVKPKRTALETVLSKLSIKTTAPGDGGGSGRPELTQTEFAGMLSGIERCNAVPRVLRIAEMLAWAYLDYRSAVDDLCWELDTFGRSRALLRHPSVNISGDLHQRIAHCMARRHVFTTKLSVHQMRAFVGVGAKRWASITPIARDLALIMNEADKLLSDHLRKAAAVRFGPGFVED